MMASGFAQVFNIYCDESCHLENDGQRAMVLGALWCPARESKEAATRIREIKAGHGLAPGFEAKWTKVSPAKLGFYRNLVDYFFDDDDLHFRALIIPDKSQLDHAAFGQDHDTWYYKMYFDTLKVLLAPGSEYRIYVDIKDTRSAAKTRKLHEILCNNAYDFERKMITRVQTVRSHEVQQMQLADLLLGVVSYENRGCGRSPAKDQLVKRMQERSGYSLTRSTLLREEKVNLLRWESRSR